VGLKNLRLQAVSKGCTSLRNRKGLRLEIAIVFESDSLLYFGVIAEDKYVFRTKPCCYQIIVGQTGELPIGHVAGPKSWYPMDRKTNEQKEAYDGYQIYYNTLSPMPDFII